MSASRSPPQSELERSDELRDIAAREEARAQLGRRLPYTYLGEQEEEERYSYLSNTNISIHSSSRRLFAPPYDDNDDDNDRSLDHDSRSSNHVLNLRRFDHSGPLNPDTPDTPDTPDQTSTSATTTAPRRNTYSPSPRPRPPIRFSRPSTPDTFPPASDSDFTFPASTRPRTRSIIHLSSSSTSSPIRLPPRPSDLPDPHRPGSRHTHSMSATTIDTTLARRGSISSLHSSSNTTRPASLYSLDTPTGRPASLFSSIFKSPPPPSTDSITSPVEPKRNSLFNFSRTPAPPPAPPARNIPDAAETIDEFAGLNFTALMESYLETRRETPEDPGEAVMRTPEGQLSEAVQTAVELLDRVYGAYRKRTEMVKDTLAELELQKEILATERNKTQTLTLTVERLKEEQKQLTEDLEWEREKSERRNQEAEAEIASLHSAVAVERAHRVAAEDRLRKTTQKRASSTSTDSGFGDEASDSADAPTALAPPTAASSAASTRSDLSSTITATSSLDSEAPVGLLCTRCGVETEEEPKMTPLPSRDASAGGILGLFKKGGRVAEGVTVGQVESMRKENWQLRQRVSEMERGIEGALEAVAGRV